MATRELASRRELRAYSFSRNIVIVAEGQVPNPCYVVDIEQVIPPADGQVRYRLVQWREPGICPKVITDYIYGEAFGVRAAGPPDTVPVEHAEGTDDVRVEPLTDGADLVADDEYIGFSRRLSFAEAFADAVAQVPQATHPDAMTNVVVTETGGRFGGIAGFHHLYVKIRVA